MRKQILFLMTLLAFAGCGQKSEISNALEAQTFDSAYGDGSAANIPIFLPITDLDTVTSPLENAGVIAGGLAKLIMNLGASMGMGKQRMLLNQRLPEVPAGYLKEARIKRVFFYIEPKEGETRNRSKLSRIFNGDDNVNFNFLDKLAIKVKNAEPESPAWTPVYKQVGLDKSATQSFLSVFEKDSFNKDLEKKGDGEALILKYDGGDKKSFLRNEMNGQIYIVKANKPARALHWFKDHPQLQGFFKTSLMLDKVVVLELHKDAKNEEIFDQVVNESYMEQEDFGITKIDACTPKICLDLRIPSVNLMPYINKGGGIQLDAFLEAGKVPETFKLKGYIEFQLKVRVGT
jgi:hypothetical protein